MNKFLQLPLLFIFLVCFGQTSSGQDTSSSDIHQLNQKAYELCFTNPDSTLLIGGKTIALSQATSNITEEAFGFFVCGLAYEVKSDFIKALELYENSLSLYTRISDFNSMASVYTYVGNIHKMTGNYEKAHTYFLYSLQNYILSGDIEGEAFAFNNLGISLFKAGYSKFAFRCFSKAWKIFNSLHDQVNILNTLNNIALLYQSLGMNEKALNIYSQMLHIAENNDNDDILISAYVNMGLLFLDIEDYTTAATYLEKAKLLSDTSFNYVETNVNIYYYLGEVFFKTGNTPEAKSHLDIALRLAEKSGFELSKQNILLLLSKINASQGSFEKAYSYLLKAYELENILYTASLAKEIADAQIRYESSQLESEKQQMNHIIAKNKQNEKTSRIALIILVISLFLLLVAAMYISIQNTIIRKKQKVLLGQNTIIDKCSFEMQQMNHQLKELLTEKSTKLHFYQQHRQRIEFALKEQDHKFLQISSKLESTQKLMIIIVRSLIEQMKHTQDNALLSQLLYEYMNGIQFQNTDPQQTKLFHTKEDIIGTINIFLDSSFSVDTSTTNQWSDIKYSFDGIFFPFILADLIIWGKHHHSYLHTVITAEKDSIKAMVSFNNSKKLAFLQTLATNRQFETTGEEYFPQTARYLLVNDNYSIEYTENKEHVCVFTIMLHALKNQMIVEGAFIKPNIIVTDPQPIHFRDISDQIEHLHHIVHCTKIDDVYNYVLKHALESKTAAIFVAVDQYSEQSVRQIPDKIAEILLYKPTFVALKAFPNNLEVETLKNAGYDHCLSLPIQKNKIDDIIPLL